MTRQLVRAFCKVGLRSMAAGALAAGLLGAIAAPAHAAVAAAAVAPTCSGGQVSAAEVTSVSPFQSGTDVHATIDFGGGTSEAITFQGTLSFPSASTDVTYADQYLPCAAPGSYPVSTSGTPTLSIWNPRTRSLETVDCFLSRGGEIFHNVVNGEDTTLTPTVYKIDAGGSAELSGYLVCPTSSDTTGLTYKITGGFAGLFDGTGTGAGTETPELSSGELLATGVIPIFGLWLYRRRRRGGR